MYINYRLMPCFCYVNLHTYSSNFVHKLTVFMQENIKWIKIKQKFYPFINWSGLNKKGIPPLRYTISHYTYIHKSTNKINYLKLLKLQHLKINHIHLSKTHYNHPKTNANIQSSKYSINTVSLKFDTKTSQKTLKRGIRKWSNVKTNRTTNPWRNV